MAVEWKRILLEGDAATLTTSDPSDVGVTAGSGTSLEAARADHVHDTAAGFIDNANKFTTGVVDSAAIGSDAIVNSHIATGAVESAEIGSDAILSSHISTAAVDSAAIGSDQVTSSHIAQLTETLDFNDNQAQDMVFHTVANATTRDALSAVLGKVVWQSDTLHAYICTSDA